jgi:serine/threonine protein kinase/tetratricopeptide (TPR) repeat protein
VAAPDDIQLPDAGLSLGAFRLHGFLGRGAMGQVFRGVHEATQVPVAVKVMTDVQAQTETFARAFRNEVEAVARLHHPAIVHIYDFGDVPAADAEASGGVLPAALPYLVTELADGGTLSRRGEPLEWPSLKAVLLQLLDALGHAHARGVIHRDLKPTNVLYSRAGAGAPATLKLTDFGLAHAFSDQNDRLPDDDVLATSGTPPYMAPEQFNGDWRSQGPWTDLYALGCLAYALASGNPPFRASDVRVYAYQHMLAPPPELEARVALPRGFDSWLYTLLAKRMEHRFLRAADARQALEALHDRRLVAPGTPQSLKVVAEASTDPVPLHTMPLGPVSIVNAPASGSLASGSPASRPPTSRTLMDRQPPPLPESWRSGEARAFPSLLRAGLSLFGLREAPLVGRDAERDALWSALRAVHAEDRPRAIVLRGAAGTGKSRVARWIAERAHEVGGATVLSASHSPHGGTHDGTLAMLLRHFRGLDLDKRELDARLRGALEQLGDNDRYLREALVDLFQPSAPASVAGMTLLIDGARAKAEERERLALRVIGLVAAERPVILHVDDGQWGLDALRLVRRLLASQAPAALAIITIREEELADRPLEKAELDALLAGPGATALDVRPLALPDQRALVAQLLGLSDDLVESLATRTGGNPLFAVQLIGDWVSRGVLVAGGGGLTLKDGVADTLPRDVEALCSARLTEALRGRTVDDALALELAALLGAEFDDGEWTHACLLASLGPTRTLMPDLARQGLLESGFSSWRFAHGVIRETLELAARTQRRYGPHHRAIAEMLRARHPGRPAAEVAIRIARHLRAADALHEAHPPLLGAARALRIEADPVRAIQILAERAEVLDALAVPAADPLRAEGDLLLSQLHLASGELARAREVAARVATDAVTHGWPVLHARAFLRLGDEASASDDWDRAHSFHQQALATLTQFGDRRGEFEARQGLAEALYFQGAHERCAEAYEDNRRLAMTLGDELAVAETLWGLGYCAMWRGDFVTARGHFEAMRQKLAERGASYRLCECFNALGEVSRLAGHHKEAEQWYWGAVQLGEAFGHTGALIARLNVSMSLLAREDDEAAEKLAHAVVAESRARSHRRALCGALVVVAAARARAAGWHACSAALVEVEELLAQTNFRDGDVSHLLELTSQRAAAANMDEIAERAQRSAHLSRAVS